ncbi:hypothetical protein CALCODRAFT_44663 [Calocera cornea HHB12733]|uniref:Uncharacterized protein n=1 Tax=Calocera cornea HHB12733 TaxID=1353952 RepID=A0A165DW41_9BASI|nr:hypothetical protein CALCODRAFT_44663 [Calocera cornea HHB12733]
MHHRLETAGAPACVHLGKGAPDRRVCPSIVNDLGGIQARLIFRIIFQGELFSPPYKPDLLGSLAVLVEDIQTPSTRTSPAFRHLPTVHPTKQAPCNKLGAERWIDFRETDDIVQAVKAVTRRGRLARGDRHFGQRRGVRAGAAVSAPARHRRRRRRWPCPLRHGRRGADVSWTVFLEKQLRGSHVGNRRTGRSRGPRHRRAGGSGRRGRPGCSRRPSCQLPEVYHAKGAGSLVGRAVLDVWA